MGKYVVTGTSIPMFSQGHGFVGSPSPDHALLAFLFVCFSMGGGAKILVTLCWVFR